ncbi:uncharacterized protein LOC114309884 [Camellia sinensis]|uniref:MBD domain-containing protein n=1 Tax=Camellia sinensis var. sinensis TaxID=542762 RepID=A0A4S4DKC7_CAMSN|nr:uncharacterized protein LOC114309884 [Camellia sinensis]THG03343.1 hypothetical protein TEA_011354 [Camellia sinensis var. sinensis]
MKLVRDPYSLKFSHKFNPAPPILSKHKPHHHHHHHHHHHSLMASATVDSPSSDRLQLESIPAVDLRLLSQSELYALSLCSDGAFDPLCDDVVIPKIDRSVFNESAGSRKQTYSRLRLAPRKPESASSTATTSSIPRRTPHLRTLKSATNLSDDTDPERAENSQIIGLLKDLFVSDINSDELVPIRVEYSDSLPNLPNVGNYGVKHLPNVGNYGVKRKRGRPRKNENLALVAAEVTEVVPVEVQDEGGDGVIKDIVVYENVEDRDKEIVNKNGNVVDLAELASLEDPYGVELQRRTENLKTEEELLGFLKESNGQWGSRRKKKKIVDANEFGDALPKGWKLLLSLKKKEGRVWMFVRRYISPNGRQFVTCKEVSSYLLSLFGVQDSHQPNCGQSNENIQLTCNMACENAADLAVKEVNKSGDLVCHSPSVITCVSNDHEKQVTSEAGNSAEIQMGDILKCDRCSMSFNEKDGLLHHQVSSHRRKKSRFGASITDGVIIKGGQFECQFCHKTFNERNRYNGHVGAHKRHHMKSDEALSGALTLQNSVSLSSSDEVPPKKSMMQTSIGDDYDAATYNTNADSVPKPVSSQSKLTTGSDIESYSDRSGHEVNVLPHDEQDANSIGNERNFAEDPCVKHDRGNKMANCLGRVDEANDDVTATFNFCLDSEVAVSGNEINSNGECTANRVNDQVVGQGRSLESCPHSPFANEKICGAEINVNEDSIILEEPNQEAGLESVSLAPLENEKSCGVENMEDVHELDTLKFDSKLIHSFGSSRAEPDEDFVTEGKQQNGSGACSPIPVSNDEKCDTSNYMNSFSTSSLEESKQKRDSERSDKETCGVKDIYRASGSSIFKTKIDATNNSGNKEAIDEDAITRVEHENSERYLFVPSWKEQLCGMKDNESVVSVRTMEERVRERGSEDSLHILSGYEQTCGVKNDMGNISTRKMEELKFDEVQTYRNNELAFGISYPRLNTQNRNLEFGSPVLSGNAQEFVEENVTGVCNSTEEHPKQKGSFDCGLFAQSCTGKTFGDVYMMNRVSTRSIEEPKPEVQNFSNNELMISFGNNGTGIVADVMNNVPMHQTFSFEANPSRENSRIGKDAKEESWLLGPSCFPKTCADDNHLSRVHAVGIWDGPMMDEVVNSEHDKLTIGFGSINTQSGGNVMPGNMWRLDDEIVLQSTSADTSTQQQQSAGCFPTFGMLSDKGENELLGVDGKYDSMSGFQGAQSGHIEPVEFSFLTMQNLNSLPGDSKSLSYNTQMDQGFDSSFWLEKDALSLNLASRNQVTSICVWCRNEFHGESLHPGTQTGGIGSMCPTCSAKVTQQFNVF